jgi:hypothetical protein
MINSYYILLISIFTSLSLLLFQIIEIKLQNFEIDDNKRKTKLRGEKERREREREREREKETFIY